MALRRRFGVFACPAADVRPVRSRSVSRAIFRGVVHETVDGARSDAIEIRDAGFVDRTLQSGECALGRGRDRHRIAGVEQSFDAGGRFVFVTAVFTGFGGIKLDVAFPGGVDAEAGEFPHVMFGEDECGDGFLES